MNTAMPEPEKSTPEPISELSARPGIRWWPALVLLLLFGLVLLVMWVFLDDVEMPRGLQVLVTYIAAGVTVLGLLIWELFFARLRSPTWGLVQLSLLIVALSLFALIRIKEADGDAWFTLTWRWVEDPYVNLDPNVKLAPEAEPIEAMATDYPGFLGENRDGIVHGVALETDWEAHPPRELWRIGKQQDDSLGAGFSAFAIVGDHAYTQELRGDEEYVSCFNVQSGELIWRNAQTGLISPVMFESNVAGDGPRATPTVHGGKVFAMGGAGVLACFDAATGERFWSADVFEQTAGTNIQWGNSCSPLVVEPHVIVCGGGGGNAQLVGYLIDTSEHHPQPAISGGSNEQGGMDFYDSPTLRTIGGVPQVLHINNQGLSAFDPATLELLWQHPWPWVVAHPFVAQPVVLPDDHILLSAAYSSGNALLQVKQQPNGDFQTDLIWQKNTLKSKFANVLVQGEYLYGLDARLLVCIEWRTGKRKWKVRAGDYGHGQLLMVGDTIIIQAESGDVALVRATPEKFEELARMPVFEDRTWNNPAFSGKYLLLRNHLEAVCFELPLASSEGPAED